MSIFADKSKIPFVEMSFFNKSVLTIVTLFYLVSCNQAVGSNPIEFSETITLVGKEKTIKNVFLKYPFRIRLSDSSLYIMDIHPTDHYCHEFAYPSMTHRRSLAKRGEAPHEFLDAENIRFDKHGSLWVLDANLKKISSFDKGTKSAPQGIFPLDNELIRTLDFDLIDDSTIVVPDYTGMHRLCMLKRDGQIARKLFAIPTSKKETTNHESNIPLAQAWRSFLHYNANHGILAMVTQLGQVLEIYDMNNMRLINVVKGSEPKFRVNGGYAVPTGIMGYSDIHVGREHIFGIFWGRSFKDIKRNTDLTEGGKFIHVFDLKGVPIRKYVLDRHITGFHIDEENNKIIGLDVNSDQPIIEYAYVP